MIAQLLLFMNENIEIFFLFFLVAIAINGKRENGFGQSSVRKKNVIN